MRVITMLALFGAAIAAPSADSSRIVGGVDARIEDFPYMSNLLLATDFVTFLAHCGGTLITTRTIVSAAHCFFGNNPPMAVWRVRLGSTLAHFGGDVHTLQEVILYPDYVSGFMYHDIGIMKLTNPAILSNSIGVASIAGPNYLVADDSPVTVIGWGRLWTNGDTSEILQSVDMRIVNHEICSEQYRALQAIHGANRIPNVTSEMICAGEFGIGGKGSCQGDSGGPLLHQRVLIGIISWGQGCALPEYPGVYVNIPSYTNWIVDNA